MKRWEGPGFRTLYLYELKKIIYRRSVWITSGIMLLLCVCLSFADLINTSFGYSEGDEEINISGYELMKIRRECARKLSGREIDDALLREMQEFYQGEEREEVTGVIDRATGATITAADGGSADREEAARDGADGMEAKLVDQQKYMPVYSWTFGIMGNDESIYAADVSGPYSERQRLIDQNRRDQMLTQNERMYWKKNDAGLKIPFTYEYMEGWGNLWNQANMINCMLLLLLISVIYSMTVMFLSEWLKKSAGVMAVPFGIMIFTLFIDIPYSYGTVSKVYELLPTNLLMTWELWDDRLLSVLGKYMTLFQVAPMVYILVSALLLLIGKRIWKRCQVGA